MEQINETTLTQPTTQQTLNTVFLEQREPLVEEALIGGVNHSDPSSKLSLSDPTTLATTKLFEKPMLVSQSTWSVMQARDTNVVTFRLPNILSSLLSPAHGLLRIHAFYRSGFKIRIQVNSSPFHSGRLIAYFNPYGLSGLADRGMNYVSKAGLPHVFIDAANATVGHLEIPFLTLKDYFTTQNSDSDCRIGDFSIDVFNALQIGTGGNPNVSVSVWLEPLSVELAVPVAVHNVELQMESLLSVVEGPIKQLLTMGLNGTSQLLGGVLGSTKRGSGKGMDRPEIPAPQNIGLCYSVPNISNGTGANPSDRLALLPTETLVDESNTGRMTSGDEMDLLSVAKTPMPIGIINWTDELATSTRLMTLQVHPKIVQSITDSTGVYAIPTYLAYVCNAFKFWRGSLRYRFEIVGTQHHTGRLLVAWIPNDSQNGANFAIASNLDINALAMYPCEVFDLALNKEFEFVVPYNSPTRYKKMPLLDRFNEPPFDPAQATSDYTLGSLVVIVQNSLTHPGTVSNNVDVNVFLSGGDDFDLHSVGPPTGYVTPTPIFQSGNVSLEGTRSGESNNADSKVGVSSSGVGTDTTQGPPKETHLKFLLSRYFPAVNFSQTLPANSGATNTIYSTPVFAFPEYQQGGCSSDLLSYFSRLYRFWTGGINHMLVHNTTVNNPIILHTDHEPDVDFQNTTNSSGLTFMASTAVVANSSAFSTYYSSLNNLRVNPTVSITTPFRSIYPKLLTETPSIAQSGLEDAARAFCTGVLNNRYHNYSTTPVDLNTTYMRGAADDFRLFYLITPPRIKIQAL